MREHHRLAEPTLVSNTDKPLFIVRIGDHPQRQIDGDFFVDVCDVEIQRPLVDAPIGNAIAGFDSARENFALDSPR